MTNLSLEEDWRDLLDGMARARGWPTTTEPARLGPRVALLSALYNDLPSPRGTAPARPGDELLSARLLFSFVRDVPKASAAVRELLSAGALTLPEGQPLRVLDLGAGLGAMTWGVARALARAGKQGEIDVTLADGDGDALGLAKELFSRRERADGVRVRPTFVPLQLPRVPRGKFDLILLGQVLSELDRSCSSEERLSRHTALVSELLDRSLEPGGSLVIVEPALRDRTRHLHALRDALLPSATVFAPCLHALSCPARVNPTDWCHEDLPIDLPSWLVPVARAAGLRWEGLTFSYLVLRKDEKTLRAALPGERRRLRVVSNRFVSKGKSEAFLCGEPVAEVTRLRATRLDRDRSDTNALWDDLRRGDLVAFDPDLPPERPRVTKESRVTRL